jgi:hypothetical protein
MFHVSLYPLLGENKMKKQMKLFVITVFLFVMSASAFVALANNPLYSGG